MGLPRGLLLAVALIAAGEAALAAALPVNQGRHRVDDLLAGLESPQPTRPVVFWSDSVSAGPMESTGGDPRVTNLASTQAISMAGVHYTYRRLRASAGPPRAFVLCVAPDCWGNDLNQVFTPTYYESCFFRWDEIADFLRTTGRWPQALRIAGNRALRPPSMVRRGTMRQALQEIRSPGASRNRNLPLLRVAGMDPSLRADLRERACLTEFEASEISCLYVDRLADDLARDGALLVLMTGALPRSVLEGWTRTGLRAGAEAFLASVAERHPNVRFEPLDLFADYPDEAMYDRMHLKPDPAREYGRRLLDRVRNPEGDAAPR